MFANASADTEPGRLRQLRAGAWGGRSGSGESVANSRVTARGRVVVNLNMPCSIPSGTRLERTGDGLNGSGSTQWEEYVVKLLRVHGECLGARRR